MIFQMWARCGRKNKVRSRELCEERRAGLVKAGREGVSRIHGRQIKKNRS